MVQRLMYSSSRGALLCFDTCAMVVIHLLVCFKRVTQVRVKGEIKPVQPSFYDDIIRLPDIIEKVKTSKVSNMPNQRWVLYKRELCVLWRRFSPILALGSSIRTCGSSTKLKLVSGFLSEAPAVLTLMRSCSTILCWKDR